MPSERAEEPWIDEMDGPERLERSKKKRAEQLMRWGNREASDPDPKRIRKNDKILKFEPNVVMLEAAARNDPEEVARLLESGVSPDLANEDGLTALHQSCIDGCDDMVKYLVEHNANVNSCDKESWTPLHAAAACGHMTIVKYLLENGGNILALNLDGNFPVDVIEDNEEVETYLEQEMAEIGYNEEAIEELRQNQGKQLLDDLNDSVDQGRSLDIQDENGATAFHFAAANGWTNVINFLLEQEADFEIADNDGWEPIHAAAAWGHDTVLEVLVASGADLDSTTNDSQTPLDLTEEDEIIELIEDLKTKQVKYPRKGKGVRRKRSNTSNSSIKRSSIHEKNEFSHADTKAEGAALLIQLQNADDSEANSPEEPPASPAPTMEAHFGERTSNSSREETSSSGYVSEASTETKTEERLETGELSKPKTSTNEVTHKIEVSNYLVDDEQKKKRQSTGNEEKSANKLPPTNIKTSPVPKPPRSTTTSSSKEPSAYINVEIEPIESPRAGTPAVEPKDEARVKGGKENVKPFTEKSTDKTELSKTTAKVEEEGSDKRSTSTSSLPRLTPNAKRKAPEPPSSVSKRENTQSPAAPANVPQKNSKKDLPNEAPISPSKRAAVPSSSGAVQQRNTAVTKSPPEPTPLPSKSDARGFSFPRSRKTCCSMM